MTTTPFGQTVLLWRLNRGLTQTELAKRARVPRPNLSAIERGRREVSLRTVRALAAVLGVQPGTLVDGIPPSAAGGTVPSSSREAIERIVDAVAFGRRVPDAGERWVVAALRTLLGQRTRAIRRRWSGPRTGPRAALAAWTILSSLYGREAIQSLADRVAERQRAHDSSHH